MFDRNLSLANAVKQYYNQNISNLNSIYNFYSQEREMKHLFR
jgi:hypothetical protein